MKDIKSKGKHLLKTLERKKFFKRLGTSHGPAQLDRMMQHGHDSAFDEIDCLQCANCCRTLGPRIEHTDITRIARKLRMPEKELITKFLRVDEDGDYVVKSLPCPFLDLEDNYCSIYEDRPRACREYPHTDRRRQHQLLDLHKKNMATCPAVQHVLTQVEANLST